MIYIVFVLIYLVQSNGKPFTVSPLTYMYLSILFSSFFEFITF
ncbi:hypothetical protein VCRA2110O135_200047 [Vibrio crassostreae]|nr:hypothetical protein VCRA2110O135_200047 [Vibrio crassostreae]